MRTILIIVGFGALAAAVASVAGCGATGGSSGRVQVVATTMQVADFARQVGGDRVEVTGLLDAEAEPHDYEPTPSDAEAVSEADLVVANGANLDDWLGDLLEQAGADAPRVEAARGVTLLPTDEEGFPGDPHVWHDPTAAARMVDNVAAGLARADPAGRDAYRRRAAIYRQRLDRMAKSIRESFAPIPPEQRDLVTSHDAFGYFARAYDLNVIGSVLPTVTTEAEPSAQQIKALVDEIRAERVRTVFTEEAVEPRLERRVAEEAGARVSTSLYADALGPPGSGTAGFVEAELANARAMRSAWIAP
ncbi:MAG: Zinc ABC transporter, substrate-binding protein ZnuA [uncultured Solirubrobacterales bacterium]|uniref:Zinc ABC transporter, substrate-binding protein ZnuA n=1 Tax=uncultured Solirubrobacterales bacterium TaxID=768556 RepID=A0A6J4S9P2_9ACTN|nr:MAG: Zinc ABC transporter, substrate-binding protein ZnuA [uncultured Solirubrobacterales bacterium]